MTASLIRGNALTLPLADDTVDLVVTSPPYFALRSYTDAGEHYAGQLGSEPTPSAFVDALIAATAEMVRVVKPSGSIFVNLGDKYSGAQAQNSSGVSNRNVGDSAAFWRRTDPKRTGIPNKSLMGIPWRYALRCIDELGLILRAEIIWAKPNGLPESVTDRVRRSHEQWFHFTLEPRYYSAVDAIRESHSGPLKSPGGGNPAAAVGPQARGGHSQWERTREEREATVRHALGKLPGSVWTIPTQPLTVPAELGVDHFAAFPMEWPRRIITGWSPAGVCTACGQGRRPVTSDPERIGGRIRGEVDVNALGIGRAPSGINAVGAHSQYTTTRAITGEACGCPDTTAPTRPGIVLDPFGGTGTTALIADVLGRHGISLDMSADYLRLARWRTTDPGERARAMLVDKPAPIADDQLALDF